MNVQLTKDEIVEKLESIANQLAEVMDGKRVYCQGNGRTLKNQIPYR